MLPPIMGNPGSDPLDSSFHVSQEENSNEETNDDDEEETYLIKKTSSNFYLWFIGPSYPPCCQIVLFAIYLQVYVRFGNEVSGLR